MEKVSRIHPDLELIYGTKRCSIAKQLLDLTVKSSFSSKQTKQSETGFYRLTFHND